MFANIYVDLIKALDKELQKHCDGSKLASIEFEVNKRITLV